jgi:hypothetical protein
MGTLDDAIREHLELKKRAGASSEELQRLESEAFGPIRREAAGPAPATDERPAPDPEDPDETTERREFDLPPDVEEPPPAPPPSPSAPPPAPASSRSWLEEEDDEEEAPAETPPPRDRAQSTSEFTAVEAADAEGRPPSDYVAPDEEGEDLLEETPDFLQETPEHDRLWFEQRPPRDFDFDE